MLCNVDSDQGLRIVDLDSSFEAKDGDITMSKGMPCDLSVPFSYDAIEALIEESGAALTVSDTDRCAILRGERIKLTEVEYALFKALIKRNGAFISREDILKEVWSDDSDAGIINVYIHYLREKLEKNGEKIIVSSRKMGYKIDSKYLGGGSNAQNN